MNITKNLILTPFRVYDNGTKIDRTIAFEAYGYRTLWQIIQSCLLTIFACTWITIHPNVPPHQCWPARLYYKLQLWLVALIMPDLLLLWAAKQFLQVRSLTNGAKETGVGGSQASSASSRSPRQDEGALPSDHRGTAWWRCFSFGTEDAISRCNSKSSSEQGSNTPGWTKTQAFFALMGGFEDEAGKTLSPYGVDRYRIKMPKKDEIRDKSKRDKLVKLFAFLQTIWFIAVTIYRLQSRILFATEIEVVTFTFALLSAITNIFWWRKPQNVDLPIPLCFTLPKSDYEQYLVDSHPPNCSSLATTILSDGLGSKDDTFICKSDIYAYSGHSTSGQMTIALLLASFCGSLYGTCHLIVGSHGGLTSTRNRIWVTLALVGSTLPLYLLLVAFIACLIRMWKEKEVRGFLHYALKFPAQIALILSGIGRICLFGVLAYFMSTPYDEGAYLTPRWSQYILHPF